MNLQAFAYPEFLYNNTYGIQAITEEEYTKMMHAMFKPGGCVDQYQECHRLEEELDPDAFGNVDYVNQVCFNSSEWCTDPQGDALDIDFGFYDIAHPVSLV